MHLAKSPFVHNAIWKVIADALSHTTAQPLLKIGLLWQEREKKRQIEKMNVDVYWDGSCPGGRAEQFPLDGPAAKNCL